MWNETDAPDEKNQLCNLIKQGLKPSEIIMKGEANNSFSEASVYNSDLVCHKALTGPFAFFLAGVFVSFHVLTKTGTFVTRHTHTLNSFLFRRLMSKKTSMKKKKM